MPNGGGRNPGWVEKPLYALPLGLGVVGRSLLGVPEGRVPREGGEVRGDAVVVLVCLKSNLMTARAADRCRGVTYMGVFVGQGAHDSIAHAQYPFKGGSTVSAPSSKRFLQSRHRSQGWYHTQRKPSPSRPRPPPEKTCRIPPWPGQGRQAPSQSSAWIGVFLGVANCFCCQIRFTARCETDASGSMEPDVPITTSAVHTGLGFIRPCEPAS